MIDMFKVLECMGNKHDWYTVSEEWFQSKLKENQQILRHCILGIFGNFDVILVVYRALSLHGCRQVIFLSNTNWQAIFIFEYRI